MKKTICTLTAGLLTAIFSHFLPAAEEGRETIWPVSDQVGMYSYREKSLVGYTNLKADGKVRNKIEIQRDENGNITGKKHDDENGRDGENRVGP